MHEVNYTFDTRMRRAFQLWRCGGCDLFPRQSVISQVWSRVSLGELDGRSRTVTFEEEMIFWKSSDARRYEFGVMGFIIQDSTSSSCKLN
jgi:hypothetical protein